MTVVASDGQRLVRAFIISGQSVNGGPPSRRDDDSPAMTVGTNADRCRAFLVDGQNMGDPTIRGGEAPALTITGTTKGTPRAFIVHPTDQRSMPVRDEADPIWTLTSGSNATRNPDMRPRAWLDEGRVVKMHPRALARFQSIPDSFVLPEKAGLATLVIGNAVPCLVAQRIGEAFLRGGR